jgi:uncharacterized repeat protein (TIGR03803 family)
MFKITCWVTACATFVTYAAMSIASAQTFTTMFNFDATNGANPNGPLTQGRDGSYYGTTDGGGNLNCFEGGYGYPYGCGTVFKITPQGTLVVLYTFCVQYATCTDGVYPLAGLVLGNDGKLYGTTYDNGTAQCQPSLGECGTVFKIPAMGTLTTLQRFDRTDGALPLAGLAQAADGAFYGTTSEGGLTPPPFVNGCGTIFKITAGGTLTTLHKFCSKPNFADGYTPQAGVIQAKDGNFYGTTAGGPSVYGTVFRMTPKGAVTTLHTFNLNDGFLPGGLVQARDGNFYGMTVYGGAVDNGTVFKITPSGEFTTLYSFCVQGTGCKDGVFPSGALVQGPDGKLYGTTIGGGDTRVCGGIADGCGTVFKITTAGVLTRLHSFSNTDGDGPGGLLQATNGRFYGTTASGGNLNCGTWGCGTVFSLNVGFPPFVVLVRHAGEVGQKFGVLGQGFIGTTGVSLNGVPARFTVKSDTFILATVPEPATTGYVKVTTPSRILTSNVPFRVIR